MTKLFTTVTEVTITTMKDKCWKGFKHIWEREPVKETRTHKLKQCERCHGKKWVARRD